MSEKENYKTADKHFAAFIRIMEPESYQDYEVNQKRRVKCSFKISEERLKELRKLWDSEKIENAPHPRIFIEMVKRIEDLAF